jgi:hypothetical protein
MADTTLTTIWDDGKGRIPIQKSDEPESSFIVNLRLVEDWKEVSKAGDYAFSCLIGTWSYECLVLLCPFCGFEAPLPFLMTVQSKDPLQIKEELSCGLCSTRFYVIKGQAIKSWFPGGIPCL